MTLIQEEIPKDLYSQCVAVILLNQTRGSQVRRIIFDFLEKYPNPDKFLSESPVIMKWLIKPLGLGERRYSNLLGMVSVIYYEVPIKEYTEIPGIGKYGSDSLKIFIDGRLDIEVEDKELKAYLERK